MTDTETYGGKCPTCKKPMFQKGPAYHGWLAFDACPWCGFAYGEVNLGKILSPYQVWRALYEHHSCQTRQELISKLDLVNTTPDTTFDQNVFHHYERYEDQMLPIARDKMSTEYIVFDINQHEGQINFLIVPKGKHTYHEDDVIRCVIDDFDWYGYTVVENIQNNDEDEESFLSDEEEKRVHEFIQKYMAEIDPETGITNRQYYEQKMP